MTALEIQRPVQWSYVLKFINLSWPFLHSIMPYKMFDVCRGVLLMIFSMGKGKGKSSSE